uniref:DNA-directed RNA polymerase n=1 Tax=Lobochlamys segnis TaxID=52035 RepID=A0A0S2IBV5_9CHLO|nr:alpha subunit of RNA polymerase [Lobochlamys segnis]
MAPASQREAGATGVRSAAEKERQYLCKFCFSSFSKRKSKIFTIRATKKKNSTFFQLSASQIIEKNKSLNYEVSKALAIKNKYNFFISCSKSRIETNRCFYGSFHLGPFDPGQSITIANSLRRTLLSELKGIAITAVEIEGALHEYSNLPGIRDSILEILLNLKEIVLKKSDIINAAPFSSLNFSSSNKEIKLVNSSKDLEDSVSSSQKKKPELIFILPKTMGEAQDSDEKINKKKLIKSFRESIKYKKTQIGYLRARGPGIVKACDLKLPPFIQCVDPDQYIATLSEDGILNMKFFINEGKNYYINTPSKTLDLTEIKKRRILIKKLLTINEASSSLSRPQVSNKNVDNLDLKNNNIVPSSKPSYKTIFASSNILKIDAIFMPVTKVNYIIESNEQFNDILGEEMNNRKFEKLNSDNFKMKNLKTAQTKIDFKHNIILEIWTNGSITPKKALYESIKNLLNVFVNLQKVQFMSFAHTKYKLAAKQPTASLSEKNYEKILNFSTLKKPKNFIKNMSSLSPISLFPSQFSQTSLDLPSLTEEGKDQKKENSFVDVKKMDLKTLNLSLRSYNSLKRLNINTIGQLLNFSKTELMTSRNFGNICFQEIKKKLESVLKTMS